jgi:hypothetical protein
MNTLHASLGGHNSSFLCSQSSPLLFHGLFHSPFAHSLEAFDQDLLLDLTFLEEEWLFSLADHFSFSLLMVLLNFDDPLSCVLGSFFGLELHQLALHGVDIFFRQLWYAFWSLHLDFALFGAYLFWLLLVDSGLERLDLGTDVFVEEIIILANLCVVHKAIGRVEARISAIGLG